MARNLFGHRVVALAIAATASSACHVERTAELASEPSAIGALRALGLGTLLRDHVGARSDGPLSIDAPSRSDASVHLRTGDVAVHVTPIGLAAVAARATHSGLVFADARAHTDLVYVVRSNAIEELRVLRDKAADRTALYRVSVENGTARVRANAVEVVNDRGEVVVSAERPWAVDACGRREDATVTLEGDSLSVSFELSDACYPVAIDPVWTTTGSMSAPRILAQAAALPSGRVIVAGGTNGGSYLNTSEIWSGSTFTSGGTMSVARSRHTMHAVSSGRVLAVGGFTGTTTATTSELHNGTSWGSTSTMMTPRSQHASVVLPGGDVLAIGGFGAVIVGNAERWSNTANTWAAAGTLGTARYRHAAAALADGRVVVAGGSDVSGNALSTAEIWNGGAFSAIAPMPTARIEPVAARVGSVVVVVGGRTASSTYFSTAEVYNPTSNTWSSVSMSAVRSEPMIVETGGKLAVIGGFGGGTTVHSSVELYDPVANIFRASQPLTAARYRAAIALATDGRVLVAAGQQATTALSSAEVYVPYANGSACTGAADCLSGFCVDGVCCNALCNAQCSACDLTGLAGTCSPVTGAPRGGRALCSGGTYVCKAGSCATSCTDDTSCGAGYYCNGSACVAKKAKGGSCTASSQCAVGTCVDGVCCASSCTGTCEACDVAGSLGDCVAVSGAPHGGRPACTGGTGECAATCDPADRTKCTLPGSGRACGTESCTGSGTAYFATTKSTCNGAGTCTDAKTSCGVYTCSGVACRTTCTGASDCIAGYSCVGGTCTPSAKLGEVCTTNAECGSGLFCTDGYCCGVASCGTGRTCGYPGKLGTCWSSNGATCTSAAECGSGFCVDGVCCNSSCDGQCEACNATGKAGTCAPVENTPVGARPGCSDGGGNVCAARRCDGLDGKSCAGFVNGREKECAASKCEGAQYTEVSKCDGKGVCEPAPPTNCAPFACGATGCTTACTDAARDCAPGATCKDGKCISQSATCSDDLKSSTSHDEVTQQCAPFKCGPEGTCLTACNTSNDCQGGATCNPATKQCEAAAAPEEDPGCAVGSRTGSAASAIILGLCALSVLGRRRRV